MKFVAVLCILCLLIIGTVSAYAISSDAVREVKIINKTIDPRTIDLSQGSSNLPQVIRLGYVSITSIPSGAAVTIDGLSTLDGTPIGVTNVSSLRMNPGDHTVTLKYPDYEDYSSAFSIKSDETTTITALLIPKKTLELARIRQPAIRVAQPQLDNVQPASGNSLGADTPIPTPTIVPISCPENSICLLPSQAPVNFPNGFIQFDTRSCKVTWSNKTNQNELSYCFGRKLVLVVKPPQDVDVRQPVQQQVPAIRKDFIGSIISIFKPSAEETIRPLTVSTSPPKRGFIESILAIFNPQSVNPNVNIDRKIAGNVSSQEFTNGPTYCQGEGVDLQTDRMNCGSCGERCVGVPCTRGVCGEDCKPGFSDCAQGCVDLQTDTLHCGKCNITCSQGQDCCGGVCANIKTDRFNCGGCGKNICIIAGSGCCDGTCLDLYSDINNCGSCGRACSDDQTCSQGMCFSPLSIPVQYTLFQFELEGSLGITPGVSQIQNRARVGNFNQVDEDGGLISGKLFRTFIHVDTISLSNGNPQGRLKKATLVLPLVKTHTYVGDMDYWQMTDKVWYVTNDNFYNDKNGLHWDTPRRDTPMSDVGKLYLSQVPAYGTGAIDKNHIGLEPASGGLEWFENGQSISTSKATWDPQKKTLTIDMTDLANKWISGEIQNKGIFLTGVEWIGNAEGVHNMFSDYGVPSFIIQP